jgi:hypothetical protein
MKTHRILITKDFTYELIEGSGAGRGCFALVRTKDSECVTTLWSIGVEGEEWCDNMCCLSYEDFLEACEAAEYS